MASDNPLKMTSLRYSPVLMLIALVSIIGAAACLLLNINLVAVLLGVAAPIVKNIRVKEYASRQSQRVLITLNIAEHKAWIALASSACNCRDLFKHKACHCCGRK